MKDILHLFLGTYIAGKNEGIRLYQFDPLTGSSQLIGITKIENSSYFVFSEDRKYLYVISENEESTSYINAFSHNPDKEKLELLSRLPSGDEGPCYITIDKNSKHILTANYGGGSISVFDIDDEGKIEEPTQTIHFKGKSVNPKRQTRSHIHCITFSNDDKYIFVTDLGTDKIYRFELNYSGRNNFVIDNSLKVFDVPKGSGPRHIVFHPSGKYLYLINELSGSVISFTYEKGNIHSFQEIQADMLHAGGSADIVITPDGLYLYASVRIEGDGVAIFSIDPLSGRLKKLGYQYTAKHPRNLRITPDGKFLLVACKDGNLIEIYEINPDAGLLKNAHQDIKIEKPACLRFI